MDCPPIAAQNLDCEVLELSAMKIALTPIGRDVRFREEQREIGVRLIHVQAFL